MPKKANDLGRDPVGRLLFRLALPAIAAQLVNALYNVVDRMYIGHMAPDGDLALTGLGLTFPIIMFVSALSALVGMGGGSRAAIAMGEGDQDKAEGILGSCVALLVCMAVGATVVFQVFREPLLTLFGASGNTLPYASAYLKIYLWGTISVQAALGLNNFITTQGFSGRAMLTVVIGAAINIVLDPIFIYGLKLGVQGAALATVLAQTVSAIWAVSFLLGKRTKLRLRREKLRLNGTYLRPVVALGVSPFIMQSTESLVMICFQSSLSKYGGDPAVGAVTIASSISQTFYMPFQGLAQGASPIIGYNYGSGDLDRVKKTFKLLLCWSVGTAAALWGVMMLFPGAFVAVFNDKPQLSAIATWCLGIYMAGFVPMSVQSACQQTFVALGQAKVSLFLALLRKIILLIPLIYIFPLFLSDKVFAVFLAEPVADCLAATTAAATFAWSFPRILRRREEELKKI